MGFLEKVGELTARLLTIDVEMKSVRHENAASQHRLESLEAKMDRLVQQLSDVSERVTRLEAQREADRALLAAEIERFKHQVERAELRLQKPLPPTE